LEKVDEDDDIGGPSKDEIEICNWYKKILTALKDLVVKHTIPIFEACFPECQALFAFDNATSHTAFLYNALITKYMNLSPARQQEKMRSTSYFYDEEKHNQDM
ncbi:9132_t:CDS:2, partial [Gigaspora margarita]